MTGYSSTVSEETALSAGLNAFLRKPFGGEQLQKLLDDLLDLPQGCG
jgi:CheY-like chemotaxis protein